ncbi:MAG TPA: Maf family protein [Vicinamibacterales bacterium]
MQLVLASASPRRADLLRAAGFTFEAIVAEVDEQLRPGEAATAYVRRLAGEKTAAALAVMSGSSGTTVASGSSRTKTDAATAGSPGGNHGPPKGGHYAENPPEGGYYDDAIILAADTAVIVNGQILGKPKDDADAAAMLRRLSGRRHKVMTGVSLRRGSLELGRVETTIVAMATLSDADLEWYVASGEPRDKAGAYAIQGLASRFISRIDGSYSNVVGLPIATVVELLAQIQR